METEGPKTRYLIVDTNIISRASDHVDGPHTLGSQIVSHLRELFERSPEWGIAISTVTMYELINMSNVDQELKRENALSGIKTFSIDEGVLRGAGHFGCFYRDLEIDKDGKQISFADKIIAATATQTQSIIYTTNMRDYPAPFFKEHVDLRKTYIYDVKKCPVYLTTYFMEPIPDVIENYWQLRVKPIKDKNSKKKPKQTSSNKSNKKDRK